MDDFTENVGRMEAGLTPAALRDARAQGLTLRERLADVARFVGRPTFARQPMAWGRVAAWALVVVFAFDLALDGLASWLIATWDEQGAFLPDPVVQDISLTEDMFSALLLAPVLEEALFRGWMTGRIAALRFALFGLAALGATSCGLGWVTGGGLWLLMTAAFLAGGVTTPLYALFLAYTNDSLSAAEMPAASGGLVFTFGLGAIAGPLVTGWAMQALDPYAFWLVLGITFAIIAVYALYRMTQRAVTPGDETDSYLNILPTASPVAVEAAGEWAVENAVSERDATAT